MGEITKQLKAVVFSPKIVSIEEFIEEISGIKKISDLDLSVDDISSMLFLFKNNIIGQVHLDYFQIPNSRTCKIIGTKGTLICDLELNFVKVFNVKSKKWKTKFDPENYKSKNFSEEVIDSRNNKVVIKSGEKINFLNAKKLQNDGLKNIFVSKESLIGKFLHKKIQIDGTEEKFDIGTELNETILDKLIENNIFNPI